jgi:uncharacterized repeat protein (TIGR04052 family)
MLRPQTIAFPGGKMKKMKIMLILPMLTLWACANTEEGTATTASNQVAATPTYNVTLNFLAKVGSADFACGTTYTGANSVGTNNTDLVAKDFRFYINDIRLVKADNSEVSLSLNQDGTWQYEGVALLDFENGSGICASTTGPTTAMNSQVKGTIAQTNGVAYTKIKFRLGIPLSLNHLDTGSAPAPLNVSALYWAWTSGRKFARLDFNTSGGGYDTGFNVHLGSVNCTGTTPVSSNVDCNTPNRAEITLNIPAGSQTDLTGLSNMRIVADLRAILQDLALGTADQGGAPGCMSGTTDPECRAILTRLGLQFAYIGTTNATRGATNNTVYAAQTGGDTTQVSAQSFFRTQ